MSSEPVYSVFDPLLPDYINFLLCPEISDLLDFQVNVGTDELHKEKIGAVKWMLIARSKVLRVKLLESKMKTSKEVNIPDLEPSIFKQFLTYIYGHDNVDSLQFKDALSLLSVAEKYEVRDLKSRLADTITPQVTGANVLAILHHGPVCETVPSLWAETTRVIQTETELLLENPQFLTLKPEAVVHILQQDVLNVDEMDVWKASLKWARHQLSSCEGLVSADAMRSTMSPLLKHTRLCTLSYAQLCLDVIPSHVVTLEEFQLICSSVTKGLKENGLTTICNEIVPRKGSVVKTVQIDVGHLCPPMVYVHAKYNYSTYMILAKKKVQQMSFEFIPKTSDSKTSYQAKVIVKISRVTDHVNNTSSESPRVIEFNNVIPYGQPVEVPFRVDQADVVLEPNTKYIVCIKCTPGCPTWIDKTNASHFLVSNSDLILNAVKHTNGGTRNQLNVFKYTA